MQAYSKSQKDAEKARIVEFHLVGGFNDDMKTAWQILKDLYNDILKDDPLWHFFFEDKYSIVRCSEEFLEKVKKRLDNEDYVYYKYKGIWIDGQKSTRKYQPIFATMFHTFSETAMHMDPLDIRETLDRVVHCFLNHQYYIIAAKFRITSIWEANLIAENAIWRAEYTGKIVGIKNAKAQEARKFADALDALLELAETGDKEAFKDKIEDLKLDFEE